MRLAIVFMFFALMGVMILLFFQQGKMNGLQEELETEKRLFDARYGEIVRLKDKIGEYQDSCFIYRNEIKKLKNGEQ